VSEVIALFSSPSQNPGLRKQLPRLDVTLVFSFPISHRNFFGSVTAPKSYQSILKHPCLMVEEMFVLRAFCASIKAHLRLMKCPMHDSRTHGRDETPRLHILRANCYFTLKNTRPS